MANPLVLMVDDELDNRVMMRYFLESWGYDVDLADNGAEAVDKALAMQPALVLLDLEMPVMDGFEACRRIKEHPTTQHIPVVLFTGLEGTAYKVKGIRKGADDYIVKTVDPEEIQARIEMILRRSERYPVAPTDASGTEDAVLSGSLEEKSFPEAFQLAMAYGQSGTLSLTDGERHGHVYLVDGNAVHADLDPFTGEAAFYKFCTWDKGHFTYQIGETSTERSIDARGQSLLLEATRRMDEWERLSAQIPSLDNVPFRETGQREDPVTLTGDEWTFLQQVDGRKTLREIGACMGIDDTDIERTALELLAGSVLTFDPQTTTRNPIFDAVPELRAELDGAEPFEFTVAQWRLLIHIDGVRDVGTLIPLFGLSPQRAAEALKELADSGFIRIGASEPSQPSLREVSDNVESFPSNRRAVGLD